MDSSRKVFRTLGASSHSEGERAEDDFYASDPLAIDCLLNIAPDLLDKNIPVWECACGQGHLSKRLIQKGYKVFSSDKVDRGYGHKEDFFFCPGPYNACNIITNPPYNFAEEFVRHAIDIVSEGAIVAMLLRLLFLEGKTRSILFEQFPPRRIGIFSFRLTCAKNGDFSGANQGAQAYAWFIWQKGFKGETQLRWIREPQNENQALLNL